MSLKYHKPGGPVQADGKNRQKVRRFKICNIDDGDYLYDDNEREDVDVQVKGMWTTLW